MACTFSCDYGEVGRCKVESLPTLICYLLCPHDNYRPPGTLVLRKAGRVFEQCSSLLETLISKYHCCI